MRYPYDHPGIYVIHTVGTITPSMAECLGGLEVCSMEEERNGDEPRTVLKGWLPDQGALLGIINALYNARYPILFVRYLRVAPEECSSAS